MRKGVLVISQELLLEKLGIQGVTLLDIRTNHFTANSIEIALTGPNMPDCPEGGYAYHIRLEDISAPPPPPPEGSEVIIEKGYPAAPPRVTDPLL